MCQHCLSSQKKRALEAVATRWLDEELENPLAIIKLNAENVTETAPAFAFTICSSCLMTPTAKRR